jgi:hypothetical protein
MKIKGEYRDILSKNGEVIVDTGWLSNVIVADYGRFLAALMKKDFNGQVGIDYMAVGSGSKDDVEFKSRVKSFLFEEFALLGIDKESGSFVQEKLFFINYVDHGLITKDENMELTRTIILTFPIGKEEVVS